MKMLLEFSVSNFRSIDGLETFSMATSPISEYSDSHTFSPRQDVSALKSSAIYGPNASGKSNLVKAFFFMQNFVRTSAGPMFDRIPIEPFLLSTESESRPSFFEIQFYTDQTLYRYNFEVSSDRVVSEALYYIPPDKKRESTLFTRTIEDGIKCFRAFPEGKKLESKTRANALFLSVVAQFNGKISLGILNWFQSRLKIYVSFSLPGLYPHEAIDYIESGKHKDVFLRFLKAADFGIEGIRIDKEDMEWESIPQTVRSQLSHLFDGKLDGRFVGLTINTQRRRFNASNEPDKVIDFDMTMQESSGTQKMFSLLGIILKTLAEGSTIIIDELDTSLHPLVTRRLIELFNSREDNPNNAQLIFCTHDTNLLSNRLFRRDQIWFSEKDQVGASHFVSLADFKIRKDEVYEKNYLIGKYGAIPYLGHFSFTESE